MRKSGGGVEISLPWRIVALLSLTWIVTGRAVTIHADTDAQGGRPVSELCVEIPAGATVSLAMPFAWMDSLIAVLRDQMSPKDRLHIWNPASQCYASWERGNDGTWRRLTATAPAEDIETAPCAAGTAFWLENRQPQAQSIVLSGHVETSPVRWIWPGLNHLGVAGIVAQSLENAGLATALAAGARLLPELAPDGLLEPARGYWLWNPTADWMVCSLPDEPGGQNDGAAAVASVTSPSQAHGMLCPYPATMSIGRRSSLTASSSPQPEPTTERQSNVCTARPNGVTIYTPCLWTPAR